MKAVLFDLEADGFLDTITRIHCLAAVDLDTRRRAVFGPSEIPAAIDYLDGADLLVGHNIKRYDLPALRKVHGFHLQGGTKVLDTMVMARTLYPDVGTWDDKLIVSKRMPNKLHDGSGVRGRHTLEAWGLRLGEHKAHYDGPWDVWSQEMQDYMVQDVETNLRLWDHLTGCTDKRSQHYYERYGDALDLEHGIAELCGMIEDAGVPFAVARAGELHVAWAAERDEIAKKLIAQFGSWEAPRSPKEARAPFVPKRDDPKRGYVKGVPVVRTKTVVFNPGSRDHIRKVLFDRGWVPDSEQMTEGGKAKVNESIVAGLILRYPELEGLSRYMVLDKRISQLHGGDKAWLRHVKPDGRIHGSINPMGTITSRASHTAPNLGQVPATKKPLGHECRSLFGLHLPEYSDWVLVGADMEGLELRGLAHYLWPYDEGEYEQLLLSGDPHWRNSQLVGLVSPDTARDKTNETHTVLRESGGKRFTYATIYGCGGKRGGEIILGACLDARALDGGASYRTFFGAAKQPGPAKLASVGKRAIQRIRGGIKGLAELTGRLEQQVERFGWVPGLDGRRVPCRSAHSALNFLIQSAGAILCKRWGVDACLDMRKAGLRLAWDGEVAPLLWVHDEYQFAVRKGLEQTVGETLVRTAQQAGERYGFRVRLDSKYVVGRTWADTH